MHKAITPIISVILLIMLTIAASVSAYFFISSSVADIEGGADLSTFEDNSLLRIVSLNGSRVIVRNEGTTPVNEVVFTLNGEVFNYTFANPIGDGDVAEIYFSPQLAAEDLEVKIFYGTQKVAEYTSPANDNTVESGFVITQEEDEPEIITFLKANNAGITELSYGLQGYCNASSDNSNDILRYNYTWKVNGAQVINNFKLKQASDKMGSSHSCGVLANGSAMCWGWNSYGQLGNGSSSDVESYSHIPVFVSGDHVFSSISSGYYHSCGLLANGSAVCWGDGQYGQLGNGSIIKSYVPTFISGDYVFSSIISGDYNSCGVLNNGSAVCWGYNDNGQLGEGSTGNYKVVPVFVSGNYNFSSISSGHYDSCGVLANGSALCWGNNNYGQLGNGSTSDSYTPVFVSGDYSFSRISSGNYHSCGVLANGSALCWGRNNYGQLGNGGVSTSLIPIFVSGNYKFNSISLGEYHSCGVLANGSTLCWGRNSVGQVGNGSTISSYIPVFVSGNYNSVSTSVGGLSSCGVLSNGSAICWGKNWYGQLGNGIAGAGAYNNTPTFVSGNYDFMDNNYYWNKNTFISLLPMNYYSPADTVVFECTAMNATSQSLPVNYTLVI
jgi:flagellin-like protein